MLLSARVPLMKYSVKYKMQYEMVTERQVGYDTFYRALKCTKE
jgi:hypothetical protein